MNRPVVVAMLMAVAGATALSLKFPESAVAPGPVADAHHALARDCQACHVLFLGPSSRLCTACHRIESIGITTVAGAPIAASRAHVPFHHYLADQNCLVCHREHEGTRKLVAAQSFSHDFLVPAVRSRCEACHRSPDDDLHDQVTGNCLQCHSPTAWKPATFDHDRYFPLTGAHRTDCSTCHSAGTYRRYTCYGCHVHSLERIRAEHEQEGIRQFDRCVDCHRSGGSEEDD